MRKLLFVLFGTFLYFLSGCGQITAVLSSQKQLDNGSTSPDPTKNPINPNDYSVVSDGDGSVTFSDDVITISPKVATTQEETHSALVILKETETNPSRDFELTLDMTIKQQLRQGSPANQWETFSLFFGYNPQTNNTKTTNYFISKPSAGAELGLTHGQIGKKSISTSPSGATPLNMRHTFTFRRQLNQFTVHRDGVLLYSFDESSAPFPNTLYDGKGHIGLFAQDAKVEIHKKTYINLDPEGISYPASVTPSIAGANTYTRFNYYGNLTFKRNSTNTATTGPLFWSCFGKKLVGNLDQQSISSCSSFGTYTESTGTLLWSVSPEMIGAYYLVTEASQKNQGFKQVGQTYHIRPDWTVTKAPSVPAVPGEEITEQLFLFDPEFSINKVHLSETLPVPRDLASNNENSNTATWPSLIGNGQISFDSTNSLEPMPWKKDPDSKLSVLHFNGSQNTDGVHLVSGNIDGKSDLRVSYWIKTDNTQKSSAITILHSKGTIESRPWWNVTGPINTTYYSSSASEVSCDGPTLRTAQWAFITVQVISSPSPVLKTFVNDQEVCSQALPEIPIFQSPIKIAAHSSYLPGSYSFPFQGSISEIAGYNISSSSNIESDFKKTADRYRKYRVYELPNIPELIPLHWDATNSIRGLYLPLPTDPLGLYDLGGPLNKTFGDFSSPAGFDTSDPAKTALVFNGLTGAGDNTSFIQVEKNRTFAVNSFWVIESWIQPGVARGLSSVITDPADEDHYLYKTLIESVHYAPVGDPASYGWGVRIGPENTVDAFVVNNYGYTPTIRSTTKLNANEWYHIAVLYTNNPSDQLKVYINGKLDKIELLNPNLNRDGVTPVANGYFRKGIPPSDSVTPPITSDVFVGLPFDLDKTHSFNGRIAILQFRNQNQTDSQIKKSCEKHKNRFGVNCN